MSVAENESAPTSSVLFASHKHLQKRCSSQTAAYLACKRGIKTRNVFEGRRESDRLHVRRSERLKREMP